MSFPKTMPILAMSLIWATLASAANISFTGSFNQDDEVQYFSFDLASVSTVTLLTKSYGGGTNAAGMEIVDGGFQPVLSLFSGAGFFLASSGLNGVCPGVQNVDPATGLCVDAYVQSVDLQAGTYFVALTQFFNVPNTPTLAEGFLQQGTGNFTGETCSVPGGSFFDETCSQRSSNYAVDFLGVTSASELNGQPEPIPEPSSLLLAASAIAATVFFRRKCVLKPATPTR